MGHHRLRHGRRRRRLRDERRATSTRIYPNGVQESIISKQNNGSGKWQWRSRTASASRTSASRCKEQIVPNYVRRSATSTSASIPIRSSSPMVRASLTDNNGVAQIQPDCERRLQPRLSMGQIAAPMSVLSNTTFGTLTFGRQYAFTNDMTADYDALGGAYAFSLARPLGSYVAGKGDTETARYNTSFKYQVAVRRRSAPAPLRRSATTAKATARRMPTSSTSAATTPASRSTQFIATRKTRFSSAPSVGLCPATTT